MQTVLQHIVLDPNPRFTGLFSRGDRCFPVHLGPGERLDLRTHFNYVPTGKLTRFTSILNLSLDLDFEGEATVECHCLNEDSEKTRIIEVKSGILTEFDYSDSMLVGFVICAGPSGCLLKSGKVLANSDHIKDIGLALIICTFHKEDLVREKISRLQSSGTSEYARIFVVDNGSTLGPLGENVTVIHSPNYGGSSGYARGIIACLNDKNVTHMILNDDDAELEPEVVFRTASFYSLLSDDFEDTVLGGTMLLSERPNIVHESGATFDSVRVSSLCQGLDVSTESGNLALSCYRDVGYFGWWYFAIPSKVVKKTGLPLPMFLKYDDVEYGLRIDAPRATLCGVSVWHPGFRSKFSEMSAYYSFRNLLITGTIHSRLTSDCLYQLFQEIEIDIAGYRYLTAETRLRAVRDYLKGPDTAYRMCKDGPLVLEDYAYADADSLTKDLRLVEHAPRRSPALRALSLNGLFSRSAGDVVLDFFEPRTSEFYRIGKILYTFDDGTGVVCARDRKRTLALVLRTLLLRFVLRARFKKVSEQYRVSLNECSSEGFWMDLLGLNE